MKKIEDLVKAIRREWPNSHKSKQMKVTVDSPTHLRVWFALSYEDRGWDYCLKDIESILKCDEGVKNYKLLLNIIDDRYANPEDQCIEVDVEFYGKH